MLERIFETVANLLEEISKRNAIRLGITVEELFEKIADGEIETLEWKTKNMFFTPPVFLFKIYFLFKAFTN